MEKDKKKKTLTISTNLKKKIDTRTISSGGKKSYSVEKKRPFKQNKPFTRQNFNEANLNQDVKKKNFVRKLINI